LLNQLYQLNLPILKFLKEIFNGPILTKGETACLNQRFRIMPILNVKHRDGSSELKIRIRVVQKFPEVNFCNRLNQLPWGLDKDF